MLTQSQRWREVQQQRLLPVSDFRVDLYVSDPDFASGASATYTYADRVMSSSTRVVNNETAPGKMATLEQNFWGLDGTFGFSPDTDTRYLSSEASNANAGFTAAPTATLSFTTTSATPIEGITIRWGTAYSGEWAVDYTVRTYLGTASVDSLSVGGNFSDVSTVSLSGADFDKLEITVTKWAKPNRRARIEGVLVGMWHSFSGHDLLSASYDASVSLVSSELPHYELKFELDNRTCIYDPDNSSGISKYLSERQLVRAYYGLRIDGAMEWCKICELYLSSWETPRNGIGATFTARDLYSMMTATFSGDTPATYAALLAAVNTQAKFPTDLSGAQRSIWFWGVPPENLPEGFVASEYSLGEIAQYYANAVGCVMYVDTLSGDLLVAPSKLKSWIFYTAIDAERQYSFPESSLDEPRRGIAVNNTEVVTWGTDSEVYEITNPIWIDNPESETRKAAISRLTTVLKERRHLSGEWRPDPSLEIWDNVRVETPFGLNPIAITGITLKYNGGLRGTFEGQVCSDWS